MHPSRASGADVDLAALPFLDTADPAFSTRGPDVLAARGWERAVVKPAISAGSRETIRVEAADAAGLRVPAEAFKGGLDWLDEATDPSTGRIGYDQTHRCLDN